MVDTSARPQRRPVLITPPRAACHARDARRARTVDAQGCKEMPAPGTGNLLISPYSSTGSTVASASANALSTASSSASTPSFAATAGAVGRGGGSGRASK